MKTIGIIGGMSWESSAEYYRIMNEYVKENQGGHHSCKCLMFSLDFDPLNKLQHVGDWNQLANIMVDTARSLEKGGAEIIIIATNTMHMMYEDICKNVDLPILHIADAVAEEIKSKQLKTVALLGTRFTMEKEFYSGRLKKKHQINTVIPDDQDMDVVHNIIYSELVMGEIKSESKRAYIKIIKKLTDKGAEGVILGCTEIPLLIKQDDLNIPIFDTTDIHAKAAVDLALN
jgi:aspartate racemase